MDTAVTILADDLAAEDKNTLAQMVDELGETGVEIAKLQDKLAETATAKKIAALQDFVEATREDLSHELGVDLPADQCNAVMGAKYVVTLGAKAKSRTVTDAKALLDMLTIDEVIELASFRLKDIDDYLTPPQRELVLTQKQEGKRKLTIKKA